MYNDHVYHIYGIFSTSSHVSNGVHIRSFLTNMAASRRKASNSQHIPEKANADHIRCTAINLPAKTSNLAARQIISLFMYMPGSLHMARNSRKRAAWPISCIIISQVEKLCTGTWGYDIRRRERNITFVISAWAFAAIHGPCVGSLPRRLSRLVTTLKLRLSNCIVDPCFRARSSRQSSRSVEER